MSTLSAFPFIGEQSFATPGAINSPLSIISANIAAINADIGGFSGVTITPPSGNTITVASNLSVMGQVQVGAIQASGPVRIDVPSGQTNYLYLSDASNLRSDYIIGSQVGGTADGLNIWDASGSTMLVSFSKQSIRFYQQVVGPVFDVGGALADTLNAATFGTGTDSDESRIQAAISAASTAGISRVYVPASMYPYSAASVSFDTRVQMVREGGDWSTYDVWAYGASHNNIADDSTAIHATRDGAGIGGTVTFPNGTYRTPGLTASVVSQNWVLAPGAVLKLTDGGSTHVIRVTARGVVVRNGIIDGNRATATGTARGLSIETANCRVEAVTVQNVLDASVFFFNADDSWCLFCNVLNGNANNISVRDSQRVTIQGNVVDATGGTLVGESDGIVLAATTAGQTVSGCKVIGNTVIVGAASTNFGIEVQKTSGDTGRNLIIANNAIRFGAACSGGISLSAIEHSTVQGNTVEANGFASTTGGIELALSNYCVVSGNVIHGGTTLGGYGIAADRSSDCAISNNVVEGGSTAGTLAGIKITSSVAGQNARGNLILGNRVKLPAAATATRGIYILANAAADCSDNILLGNDIECAGDASSRGIVVEQSAGIVARTQLAYNSLRSCNEGIRQFNDTETLIGPHYFVLCTNNFGSSAPGANGRKVDYEGIGADRGDANVTLVLGTDEVTQRFATTLTANRTVTLPASRRVRGARYRVVRTGLGAFTLDVGGVKTVPSATAAAVDVEFDGTNWVLTGYDLL